MSNLLDLPPEFALDLSLGSDLSSFGEFLIHGLTVHGKPFRPSDWSERLCGVMAVFRPGAAGRGRDALIGYSPYVRPMAVGSLKCVLVDPSLRDLEPMALDFVVNFARDNALRVTTGGRRPFFEASAEKKKGADPEGERPIHRRCIAGSANDPVRPSP